VRAAPPVDDRLAAVAAEEGWDEADVAAVRAYLEQVPYPARSGRHDAPAPLPAAEPPGADASHIPASPGETVVRLPGADELDDAMSALARPAPAVDAAPDDAAPPVVPTTSSTTPERAWAKTQIPGDAPATPPWPARDSGVIGRPGSVTRLSERSSDPEDPMAEPEWLRGRRDAAARAYRRLRRIFPTTER
jgi:hypothetical protein